MVVVVVVDRLRKRERENETMGKPEGVCVYDAKERKGMDVME